MASEIKVNTIKKASGSSITVGESGDTVTLASGAVVSGGFKDIQWQSVITADGSTNTTAEAGKGYIINSSSATHTVNLPASPSAGDQVAVIQSGSNTVTINRNGNNIISGTDNIEMTTNSSVILIYSSESSIGWVKANNDVPDTFVAATGGTVSTSGDFKIHTFTSSGCFAVSSLSNVSANNEVSYLVVAGGGGGGTGDAGGGGGAGGFREGKSSVTPYTASPLAVTTGITVTATTYPVTVGAGGAGGGPQLACAPIGCGSEPGDAGSNSVFSTITSAGGGYGGQFKQAGGNGGSGGGGGGRCGYAGGTGNTPPVSPSQGFNGGTSNPSTNALQDSGGGGGGASAVGANGATPSGGNGGAGSPTAISGSATAYAGGGGGGRCTSNPFGSGGTGGGGNGGGHPGTSPTATGGSSGTANTGGGGGGIGLFNPSGSNAGSGGSGVVIIRYKYQ